MTDENSGIFLISMYGVQARGINTPNVLVGVLIFFGGVCQFIAGIMEFVAGNTVSITPPRSPLPQRVGPARSRKRKPEADSDHPTSSARQSSPRTAPSTCPTP